MDDYAGRDGVAEAITDASAGKPLNIYAHAYNGVVTGYASPGLVDCSPTFADQSPGVFVLIGEADFFEGETRTAAQNALAQSAFRFAKAYNSTTFRLRRRDVERVCPHVRADGDFRG